MLDNYDELEMLNYRVLRSSWPKAAKEHPCNSCHNTIQVGDKYNCIAVVCQESYQDSGFTVQTSSTVFTVRTCLDCHHNSPPIYT